jgi:hypothetical protein
MRTAFIGLSLAALAGCGGEEEAAGPVTSEPAAGVARAEREAVRIPLTIADTLTLVCGEPFAQHATAGTLADIFGPENVVPQTIESLDGQKRNVTVIYPMDLSRRVEVTFANEEERTVLTSASVRGDSSQWTGVGGINLGDGIETVERLNGGPFTFTGFGGEKGGFVTDWHGGKLKEVAVGCRTNVRFNTPDDAQDPAIRGEGPHSSQDPAIRAAAPYVEEISIRWLEEHEY